MSCSDPNESTMGVRKTASVTRNCSTLTRNLWQNDDSLYNSLRLQHLDLSKSATFMAFCGIQGGPLDMSCYEKGCPQGTTWHKLQTGFVQLPRDPLTQVNSQPQQSRDGIARSHVTYLTPRQRKIAGEWFEPI